MCGISGMLNTGRSGEAGAAEAINAVRGMSATLVHRGPDSDGVWYDAEQGICLGFRRLSILDVSPRGNQPMSSPGGRYVIVFNGEIYNYRELRNQLTGKVSFNSTSDTEVILATIEAYGLEAAVQRFRGMFAFALWDRQSRRLHLVRDRVGIKPLYYGWVANNFVFASELRAFRAVPEFDAEIDRDALALLLRRNCIPAPYSIYRNIRKLPPGTMLSVEGSPTEAVRPQAYWSARDVAEHASAEPLTGSDAEAADALEELLLNAVKLHMVTDVPLGAFLSGGIDSSTVVALMQAQSDRPVRTYSIGSPDAGFDEAQYARRVAQHLGTDHTELYVTAAEALAVIPKLASIYDEPFADSSQIPTFLVSELARRVVTVSLSGDGGDELFGGYNRYVWGSRIWNAMRWTPAVLRQGIAYALEGSPPAKWDRRYESVERLLPVRFRQRMFGYKTNKLAGVITARDPFELYHRLASHWVNPQSVVIGASWNDHMRGENSVGATWSFAQQMMYLDMVTYLPDDILTKLDRASMAVSLEGRVPLLDHHVVEFAWRVPMHMKIRNGQGKWLLRQVLHRYVPADLIERPKSGFGIPLAEWLRGPLRDWAESLLDVRRLRDEGYFHPQPVREKWAQHLSGRGSWEYHLWDVLMFQAWLDNQRAAVQHEHALPIMSGR
jgi:asparagine synthase (glutamine-hydrolysing)